VLLVVWCFLACYYVIVIPSIEYSIS
jgi:hypothetical protein